MKSTKMDTRIRIAGGLRLRASTLHASIIDEWASVKTPAAPALKPVTVDAKDTALVLLDLPLAVREPELGSVA